MTFVLFTNGPVSIGSTALGGITNIGSALGSQVRGEPTSGEIYARVMALMSQKPSADFTTEDIEAALTAVGPLGVSLDTSNLTLYGAQIQPGGTIYTTSSHVALSCSLGVLVPTTLQCSHQGNASISYTAHPVSADGIATPWSLTTSAALPSISGTNLYTLDTVEIGGVSIAQDTQVSVDFGLRVLTEGASSNILDQIASIRAIMPKISLTSLSQGNLLSNLLGAAGAFSIVLRRRAAGGAFTSNTVTLSGTCLALQEVPFRASGQGAATTQLQGHVEWNGTDAPITYVGT